MNEIEEEEDNEAGNSNIKRSQEIVDEMNANLEQLLARVISSYNPQWEVRVLSHKTAQTSLVVG
jgi:Rod binding domain-containing protein